MAKQQFVTVTAPPGRTTPVHSDDGREPGGGQLMVTSDVVCRVRWSQTTMRAVGRQDLLLCDLNGAPVQSFQLALAPEELEGGKIVLGDRRPNKTGGAK